MLPLATVPVVVQCGLGQLHTDLTFCPKPWFLYLYMEDNRRPGDMCTKAERTNDLSFHWILCVWENNFVCSFETESFYIA